MRPATIKKKLALLHSTDLGINQVIFDAIEIFLSTRKKRNENFPGRVSRVIKNLESKYKSELPSEQATRQITIEDAINEQKTKSTFGNKYPDFCDICLRHPCKC